MTEPVTPGPWVAESIGVNEFAIRAYISHDSAFRIATVKACNKQETANARLIAAAPDLLAALKLSLQRLGELNRDDEAGMRIVMANAIAKATALASADRTGEP